MEELKKELEQLKAKLESSVSDKVKTEIKSQIDAIEAKLAKVDETNAEVKAIKTSFDELKEEFNQFNAKAAEILKHNAQPERKSFTDLLREAIKKGAEMYKSNKGMSEVEVKAAISSSNFTNDTTNNTRVIAEQREAGINKTPKRMPFMRDLAFNGTATSDTISWTEKTAESGDPIPMAELASYPEETSSYSQFSTAVKKIGGMTKVSEEKLEDVEWMLNEIQQELIQRHDLVVDTQLLSGAGTGANLKGVLEYATTFAAGSFAVLVESPTRVDVLRVAYNQIILNHFIPNAIIMHPTDVAFMELEKDADGRYITAPFAAADGSTIKGLPVVTNTGITAGTFLMGDFTRLGVFAKGGAVLEIGRDGSDFSTDQVTVKLRERLAARIKGRDTGAFVKGTFSTAITAITKP